MSVLSHIIKDRSSHHYHFAPAVCALRSMFNWLLVLLIAGSLYYFLPTFIEFLEEVFVYTN
jgi:hypothetical protein